MNEVIYVDVLVIINIYINYALLLLTCFIRKYNANRLRLLLSALFGGLYSLIIVVPDVKDFFVAFSRIPALLMMVYLAFGFGDKRLFAKFIISFLGVNFFFAGVMFALWFFFAPENMYFNNGVVYFNIDTVTLVLLTVTAYAVIKLIGVFSKNSSPTDTVYRLELTVGEKIYACKALYDTGNNLCDPFSGEGIIIVSVGVLGDIVNENIFESIENSEGIKYKLIPARSVSGQGLLPSFRADKAQVTGRERTVVLNKPVIALCKEKIHAGEYGALLYSSVFDNSINEKGDSVVLQI